jgi:outer membrane receptor protein involved in Fe transport
VSLSALAIPPAAIAAPAAPAATMAFHIAPGPLNSALLTYAAQSHRQMLYDTDLVAGLASHGLLGQFTEDDALTRLLSGSGIVFDLSGPEVVVLKRRPARSAAASDPAPGVAVEPTAIATSRPPDAPEAPGVTSSTEMSAVVVTGTQIRRVSSISPLTVVSRDAMDRAGQPTVADMLQALPQNFGGVSTPATQVIGTDRLGTNDTGATGVNLRGLGATATLVLVDGRRMAGSGVTGDFADVSAIPTAAVDHVEVLLDGASALYGSDAVGGVVNIIMRHDFDGAETRFREGFTSDGGAQETQVGQTFGKVWSSGNALLSLEYDGQDNLRSDQRPYTASADLRPFGGTDQRPLYAHPGNILVTDPATGAEVPTWAIPPGQNGVGLTPSRLLAGQVNLSNQRKGTDVLPRQTRYSLYASANQRLTGRVTFNGDVRYTDRQFAYDLPQSVAVLNVTSANPYFVSPNGASSELIGYSFADELGPLKVTGSAQNLGTSAGLTVDVGRNWQGEVYGAYAEEIDHRDQNNHLNTAFLSEALGTSLDDPLTPYRAARDGYFNPFGDGGANGSAVLGFINSGYIHSVDVSQVTTANLKIDGTLFTFMGGDWKLAFGGQARWESFEDRFVSETSRDHPTMTLTGPFQRLVTAAFGELRAPLVGGANALPGIEHLELSVAGRVEHYDKTGTTANPKVGMLWSPVAGLKIHATYGASFRAPALTEVYAPSDIGPGILPDGASQKLVLYLDGGNLNLKPETATSWTIGFDLTPKQLPGLSLSATWFDTRFTNQIGSPVADDIFNALVNPIYAPFITPIDPSKPTEVAKVAALLAQSNSPNASLFPASAYTAIVDGREVNTGGLLVRGVDVSAAYGFRLGDERIDLAGGATILVDYRRQVTPTSPSIQFLGTGGEPVDLRARGTTTWTHGPFATSVTVNYVDGYHDSAGKPVGSWTTADLQLLWRPTTITGVLARTTVALNVQNLADSAPPFYNAPQGVGYDPANANPLGRVVSLQVTKRW